LCRGPAFASIFLKQIIASYRFQHSFGPTIVAEIPEQSFRQVKKWPVSVPTGLPSADRHAGCPTRLQARKRGNAVFASELIDAMRTSPDAVNILRQEVEGKDAYSDLGRAWLYPNAG
jgi:hypothetical protein